ncbi:diguanylate cyclase (GGDEF) domain-containing protein [Ruminococcaceae bacterium FB2012]|nr:diguanylate cyclase (GGDEF) domain-containing protein [Ruminococcaceae bacterium FB2012]
MSKMKELALIVAGIDEEYQNGVIDGIIACAKERGASVSCFAAFGGVITGKGYDIGEYNIYNLINFDLFDGVLLMINTISDSIQKQKIVDRIKDSGLPTVVFDCEDYPEFYNITIDNTTAMEELVRHVIKVHGAKRLEFISGPASNPEAQARLAAFRRVCLENDIPLSEDSIHYGSFRSIDGRHMAEQIVRSRRTLPDALICANDAMALTAIREFTRHGIKIPEDMIVTGFDDTYNARHHYPSLTTVERPLNQAGWMACETVLRLINGEECDKVRKLDSRPVLAESCGCQSVEDTDIPAYKKSTYQIIDSCREDINLLNRLNSELAEAETETESMSIISGFLGDMNCERCCLCLCDGWDSPWGSSGMMTSGYAPKMNAPLIWDKGAVRYFGSFDTTQMNPIPHDEPGSISYFLPLHFRERCLGYFVATNGSFPTKSMLCHSVLMIISNSLENVRKLISLNSAIKELDRLYVIDPLCGIYNRNGFIRAADAKYRECRRQDMSILISFIDMDGLKHINDDFGHNEGDLALQRLSSIIVDCCRDGWICARFGGDEFIILGPGGTEKDAQELNETFRMRLAQINKLLGKPYEISASIGTICEKISDSDTMFGLITRADELMYEQKKKKPSRYIRR